MACSAMLPAKLGTADKMTLPPVAEDTIARLPLPLMVAAPSVSGAAPFWVIGAAAFALLYVLAPFDLLPDALPFIGQIDDLAVVSICIALVRQELSKYEAWRKSRGLE